MGRGEPEVERVVVLNGDIIDFDLVTAAPDDLRGRCPDTSDAAA